MLIVVTGTLSAGFVLRHVGRGGAMSPESMRVAVTYVLNHYLPLWGVVAAFYLAERQQVSSDDEQRVPVDSFFFASLILLLWASLPPVAFGMASSYEGAIEFIDSLRLYGFTLAGAALTFIFARSSVS